MPALSPANIKKLYAALEEANPNPDTELVYHNPYTLLIAVLLSAQATDKGVNKATKKLFAKIKTPQAMCALGEEKLLDYIKSIGLYRTKGRNIIALSQMLVRDFAGKVPNNRKALESLPGIGRKSANVILNTIFGEEVIAVDTHVFRVANRTGLAPDKKVEAVEAALMTRTPKPYRRHAHHWLVLLGRYVCVARAPKCAACPVAAICLFSEKTI